VTDDSRIEEPRQIDLPCVAVSQPLGTFYVASIDSHMLCDITKADVRRMVEERPFETYLGIQRPLNANRVREIGQYVNTLDACFPTSVILAIDGRCAEYFPDTKSLRLSNFLEPERFEEKILYIQIARVLDGQHRIEGLREFSGENFEVNVVIFVDIDIEDQAYLFSTVNLNQTKVNRSLVYDLFELAKTRSPQKTCHNIAVALDQNERSPFFHRIKRLGSATKGRTTETITQATFVTSLMQYISNNVLRDRDQFLRGTKPPRADEEAAKVYIFRNMFLDERDLEIADVIWNYFDAVRARWPIAWAAENAGYVLGRTNGFRALMRLLRPLYLSLAKPGEVPPPNRFMEALSRATIEDVMFTVDTFIPGSAGEALLYRTLLDQTVG